MVVELGHVALIVAFLVALVQMVVPMVGAHRGWADWMRVAAPAAVIQFALTLAAFLALMHAFVVSDFSVRLVAANSHSAKPLIYKIAGTWGNHEGSMMLWMLILTLFGAMVAVWGDNLPPSLKARVLAVQATIAVAFFAFILLTSNPFVRLPNPPLDGNDLNPLLQDPGLAFHPPFLYLGYVGLSMAYSFAIAALIEGRVDAAWARWVRPWTLLAWVFLTIGIAFGSIWAYYELGWGGWWFWDPVENVSFMPWLVACALLHSAIVVEKRGTLKSWTILLAILAFSFSLVGAFIVRSGILDLGAFVRERPRPRHVPAPDPRRLHRRLADALRRARRDPALDHRLRPRQPRERPRRQQPPARRRRRRRLRRHHVAARRRGRHRPQGLGRRALLQPRLLALHDRAGRDPAGRRGAALEARPPRQGAPPDARRPGPRARARRARLGDADRPVDGGAGRGGARRLAGVRRALGARRPA